MSTYVRKDRLYNLAKEEGYRSRASYKLVELDKKYRLFRKGMRVLDLGCFPGGWLQVAAEKVGPKGKVVGIDLREVRPIPQTPEIAPVEILHGDITDPEALARIRELMPRADIVLSDLSPHLTGIPIRDAARSAELVDNAFSVAHAFLVQRGSFVVKAFPNGDLEEVIKRHKKSFKRFDRTCLESSRTTSNELYLIGREFVDTPKAPSSSPSP